jgi:aspartate 1-decarboxylase
LDYEGNLPISSDLDKLVGLLEYEKILVGNLNNDARFETYAIYGSAAGNHQIKWRHGLPGKIGDRITIMSFVRLTRDEAAIHRPQVLVTRRNERDRPYDEGDLTPSFKVVGE